MKRRDKIKLLYFLPRRSRQPILWCFLFLLTLTLISVALYPSIQGKIPLFYSLTKDFDQLANKEWIFLFPGISLGIMLINTLLIAVNKHFEPLIINLFTWATLGLQIILTMIFIRLIFIIF